MHLARPNCCRLLFTPAAQTQRPRKATGFKHTWDAGQRRGAHKAAAGAQSTHSASPLNQTTFFLKTADLSSRSP